MIQADPRCQKMLGICLVLNRPNPLSPYPYEGRGDQECTWWVKDEGRGKGCSVGG